MSSFSPVQERPLVHSSHMIYLSSNAKTRFARTLPSVEYKPVYLSIERARCPVCFLLRSHCETIEVKALWDLVSVISRDHVLWNTDDVVRDYHPNQLLYYDSHFNDHYSTICDPKKHHKYILREEFVHQMCIVYYGNIYIN